MSLEPGNYYWILSPDEYAVLVELMGDYAGDSFLGDFVLYDGNYYAYTSSIDPAEQTFLEDMGLLNPYYYILSTQAPGDL